ncbi:MAG TPA: hypothetical protein VGN16_16570 [Acidobacteriaceae bacterium]
MRSYQHRHKGLGFEILDSESEACFVPDQEYILLDSLIDQVEAKIKFNPKVESITKRKRQALEISKAISDTLAANGFGLYIPTGTLGDALLNRASVSGPERHIFDCDTGSFIFLTISESLNAPVSMVYVPLSSETGHNYVQWKLDDLHSVNWDLNGRAECRTPNNLRGNQGKSMTREQTMGYALYLRADIWSERRIYDRALGDFRSAMKMDPEDGESYNNFAWMIATKDVPKRSMLVDEALAAAITSTTLDADHYGTLACVYALKGEFLLALHAESKARSPGHEARLSLFRRSSNCTGLE